MNRLAAGLWQLHDRPGGFAELERDRLARARDAMGDYFAAVAPSPSVAEVDSSDDAGAGASDRSDPEADALDALARGSWDDIPHAGINLSACCDSSATC